MPNCNVCTETFNKRSRSIVKCQSCDFECCRQCAKTFILSKEQEACCMNCSSLWSREFLFENFEKQFVLQTYKLHCHKIIFKKESDLFHDTQPFVEREHEIEKLEKQITEITNEYTKTIHNLQNQLSQLHQTSPQQNYTTKCPNDNCHGFLSSATSNSHLTCGVCINNFCHQCLEITHVHTPHTCPQDILATMLLLQKETKKCPKCFMLIMKIDGCDQMYCTQCGIAFDWNTLEIEHGTIHNPHFYEQQKQKLGYTPRNPLDIQCGREIDAYFISVIVQKYGHKLPDGWRRIFNDRGHIIYYENNNLNARYQNLTHLNWYEHFDQHTTSILDCAQELIYIRRQIIPRMSSDERDFETAKLQLRIDFMRSKITKEAFVKAVDKLQNDNSKKHEITDTMQTYIVSMTDILYRFASEQDVTAHNNIEAFLFEMHQLRNVINERFQKLSVLYHCKRFFINEQFTIF